jgi:outer membrane protein assembly factor BamA
VELSSQVLGSDYEFSKFTLTHDTYFPLGKKGHSIRLGLFAGLIMGDAPFYNQFFVGDFSSFVPARLLELNFSHLQPRLLDTSVQEMRYEDLAGSLSLEYSIPFYRGQGMVYGVNGFVNFGIFALASGEDLLTDPQGYQGYEVVPMDLTANLGVKIDTRIGVFLVSVANLFRLIPKVGEEMAK